MSCLEIPLHVGRVTIDRLTNDDVPAFAAYRTDPNIARWQSWDTPYSIEQAQNAIRSMSRPEPGSAGERLNLAVRTGTVLIGDVYLHVIADTPHIAEIGATLSRHAQGQGYATESLRGLMDAVFAAGEVIKVIAYVDVDNNASLAMCRRLGLEQEGRLSHSFRRSDGTYADEVLFGLVDR